jgi:hypothetical protein
LKEVIDEEKSERQEMKKVGYERNKGKLKKIKFG